MGIFMFFVLMMILSNMIPGGGRGGFGGFNPFGLVSRIVGQIISGIFRGGRHFSPYGRYGPPPEITVHQVTLREKMTGKFVLVRIEGDFVEGTVESGHDIEVEGAERNGTIHFRWGINHSLGLSGGTQIRVAYHRGGRWF
jgi:hypothetical protein